MFALEPLSFPVGLAALAHAWAIPELYARRGANVVRPRPRAEAGPEQVALGLLGDLVGHDARELHARTGLVPERGALGVWLVAEAGAVLVTHGGRRVFCWCVQVPEPGLPSATASRTCCSRCAPTRRASPPSPTSRSAARRGGCAGGCRRARGPRSTPGSVWPACRAPRCEDGVNGPCPIRACGPDHALHALHISPAASSSCPPPRLRARSRRPPASAASASPSCASRAATSRAASASRT